MKLPCKVSVWEVKQSEGYVLMAYENIRLGTERERAEKIRMKGSPSHFFAVVFLPKLLFGSSRSCYCATQLRGGSGRRIHVSAMWQKY